MRSMHFEERHRCTCGSLIPDRLVVRCECGMTWVSADWILIGTIAAIVIVLWAWAAMMPS